MNMRIEKSTCRPPRDTISRQNRFSTPHHPPQPEGFVCTHCGAHVVTSAVWSGVQNRNHCPFCLWSRHLDWLSPGDRLSACKSPMRPLGVTAKSTRNKYGPAGGELMLIHECVECEKLSINRLAADDDPETIYGIFTHSMEHASQWMVKLEASGIRLLNSGDRGTVCRQLFGQESVLPPVLSISLDQG